MTLRLNRHHIRILQAHEPVAYIGGVRFTGPNETYTSRYERYRNQLVEAGYLRCQSHVQGGPLEIPGTFPALYLAGPLTVDTIQITDTGRKALKRTGWNFLKYRPQPLDAVVNSMTACYNRQQAGLAA